MLHVNYSVPLVCVRLKIPISAFKIAKLAQYDICDSLAIFCFTFHRRLSHYGSGAAQREKNSARPGKHTENHLNRKCKDNESAIHNTRPLCLPRIAELYIHLQTVKTRFLLKDTFRCGEIVFLIAIRTYYSIEYNNNEIRAAIHLIRDLRSTFEDLFI